MGITSSNLINSSVNNYAQINNKTVYTPNFEGQKPQIKDYGPDNLITRYLNNLGIVNQVNISTPKESITPSGIKDYNNYTEYDKNGNKVVDVQYSQEGDTVLQRIKTVSADGTTVERVVKNNDVNGDNSMHLEIKDKSGNILLKRDKVYTKTSDDTAQNIVNGEVYNISGLKSDVLKIEHNGEVTKLDLNKMMNIDVVAGIDNNDNPEFRNKKITQEEKEKIFNKIKELQGDDLVRLSKSVNSLQYFSGEDEFFIDKGKTLLLQTEDFFGTNVTIHELGHGYNHINMNEDGSGNRLSNSENMKNIREKATKEYLANKYHTPNDERFFGKFLDTKYCMERGGYKTEADANLNLQDEIFAEAYSIINSSSNIDIAGGGCPGRIYSMMKYMPEALLEVNKYI